MLGARARGAAQLRGAEGPARGAVALCATRGYEAPQPGLPLQAAQAEVRCRTAAVLCNRVAAEQETPSDDQTAAAAESSLEIAGD